MEHPKKSLSQVEFNLQLFLEGVRLQDNTEVRCRYYEVLGGVRTSELRLAIHNPTDRPYESTFRVGVMTPELFIGRRVEGTWHYDFIPLPDGRHLHYLKEINHVSPGGWERIGFALGSQGGDSLLAQEAISKLKESPLEVLIIRVFTDLGTQDFSVQLRAC